MDAVADAGNLGIERIKREQCPAFLPRGIKHRQIAVAVLAAHGLCKMVEVGPPPQSTATSAAATARSSARRTL